MKATELYAQLEKDFITPQMSDDWAQYFEPLGDFITDNFKKRSMGLVCDFSQEINHVYTAVFPSNKIMSEILAKDTKNALLFVHHPEIWDIRQAPKVFQLMDKSLLQKFKDNNIAIYNLHVPLDNYGEYSTSVTLAKALDIEPTEPFAPYFGSLAGVLGKTQIKTVSELQKKFSQVVGHEVGIYKYGDDKITEGTVAVVAGGGLTETIEDVAQNNINILVTGITAKSQHSLNAHEFAQKNKINLLGGTHYSTEKFACQAMTDYFVKQGLPAEFIDDTPVMEDI